MAEIWATHGGVQLIVRRGFMKVWLNLILLHKSI